LYVTYGACISFGLPHQAMGVCGDIPSDHLVCQQIGLEIGKLDHAIGLREMVQVKHYLRRILTLCYYLGEVWHFGITKAFECLEHD
jgi:hypothetical protein